SLSGKVHRLNSAAVL
ncbi:hypothetical protein ACNVD4_23710, partial [Rhizobium sp. BR5]